MVSDDAFGPRRASASSAAAASAFAAAPPPSTLATESPFMASTPLAWARPSASGSRPPAPRSPAPSIARDAALASHAFDPAQLPYGAAGLRPSWHSRPDAVRWAVSSAVRRAVVAVCRAGTVCFVLRGALRGAVWRALRCLCAARRVAAALRRTSYGALRSSPTLPYVSVGRCADSV